MELVAHLGLVQLDSLFLQLSPVTQHQRQHRNHTGYRSLYFLPELLTEVVLYVVIIPVVFPHVDVIIILILASPVC